MTCQRWVLSVVVDYISRHLENLKAHTLFHTITTADSPLTIRTKGIVGAAPFIALRCSPYRLPSRQRIRACKNTIEDMREGSGNWWWIASVTCSSGRGSDPFCWYEHPVAAGCGATEPLQRCRRMSLWHTSLVPCSC